MSNAYTILNRLHQTLSSIRTIEHGCDEFGQDALYSLLDSTEFRNDLQSYLEICEELDGSMEPAVRLQLIVQMSKIIAEVRRPHFARNRKSFIASGLKAADLIAPFLAGPE